MTEPERTCAICVELATSGAMEPMGKGGAMVFVCAGCSTNKPTQRLGPERGYEAKDRTPTYRKARHIATALIPQLEEWKEAARNIPVFPRALAHGYRLVRVARFDPLTGRARDAREAKETLRKRPYYASLRSLGTDARHFLFEYPDSAVTPPQPTISQILAPLEPYRATATNNASNKDGKK